MDFKKFAATQARQNHISFVHDFEWNNFCEELLSYFNEKQQLAEWNEEDELFRNNIITYLNLRKDKNYPEDTKYPVLDAWIDWLKSLRFRLKQKWSKEDKEKLNRICEILDYAADDRGFLKSKRIISDNEAIELQDFLRSIAMPWKPSEEQMKTLKCLPELLRNFKLDTSAQVIEVLYEQLQKLL